MAASAASAASVPRVVPFDPSADDAGASTFRMLKAEANVVAALCTLVFAVVLDALTSVPSVAEAEIPASFRCSSLVLVAFLAAPPISKNDLFDQRVCAAVLLVLTALLGLHVAELNARVADAVFSLGSGYALIGFFALSGLDPSHSLFDYRGSRENLVALAAALLVYNGARIARSGCVHASEVVGFRVYMHDAHGAHNAGGADHADDGIGATTAGLAVASDVLATSVAFGGTVVACQGLIMLLNHDLVYVFGSEPISASSATLSVAVFASAFVALLASIASINHLNAVFGPSACVGDAAVCAGAYRTRRFHFANAVGPTGGLMACAVAMTILGYSNQRRCDSRRRFYKIELDVLQQTGLLKNAETAESETPAEDDASRVAAETELANAERRIRRELDELVRAANSGSAALAAVAFVVAALAVWLLVDGIEDDIVTGAESLLLFSSVAVAWWSNTTLACLLHAVGLSLYAYRRLDNPFEFDTSFFTYTTMAITLGIVFALSITTLIAHLLYASCCSRKRWIEWVDFLTATLIVALVSVQLILTLATLGAVAGFEGAPILVDASGHENWNTYGLDWVVSHSISFFFAAALAGSRYEHNLTSMSWWWLRAAWFAPVVATTILWATSVAGTTNPYDGQTNFSVTILGTLCALVPWTLIGLVVC